MIKNRYLFIAFLSTMLLAPNLSADTSENVFGVDVSWQQGTIQWNKASQKLKFAVAQASAGEGFTDPKFQENWNAMLLVGGITMGAYHTFYPGQDGKKQAQLFLTTGGKVINSNTLPPVLRLPDQMTTDVKATATEILAWLDAVEKGMKIDDKKKQLTGVKCKPIIYTNKAVADNYLTDKVKLKDYGLWIVDLQGVKNPPIPKTWKDWKFYQFSRDNRDLLDRIKVNLEIFNGSEQALQEYVKTSNCQPSTEKATS